MSIKEKLDKTIGILRQRLKESFCEKNDSVDFWDEAYYFGRLDAFNFTIKLLKKLKDELEEEKQ